MMARERSGVRTTSATFFERFKKFLIIFWLGIMYTICLTLRHLWTLYQRVSSIVWWSRVILMKVTRKCYMCHFEGISPIWPVDALIADRKLWRRRGHIHRTIHDLNGMIPFGQALHSQSFPLDLRVRGGVGFRSLILLVWGVKNWSRDASKHIRKHNNSIRGLTETI